MILHENYQELEKIDKLINLGDLSSLAVEIEPDPNYEHSFDKRQEGVVVAYKRDRGEKDTDYVKDENLEQFIKRCKDGWEEYAYLYDDGKWLVSYIPYHGDIEFEELEEQLKELDLIDSDIKI